MDLHERHQFDLLLELATERFAARLQERHRGPEPALVRLAADGGGADTEQFVAAFFQDMLLDAADGGAFVLQALAKRPVAGRLAALADAQRVEDLLLQLAQSVFSELLVKKTTEHLQRLAGYLGAGSPAAAGREEVSP